MKFCTGCGAQLDDYVSVCPYCNKELTADRNSLREMGEALPGNSEVHDFYIRKQRGRVPVKLAEGEVLIRKYYLTRFFLRGHEGMLYITNKRVIFSCVKPLSKVVLSTPVEKVGTINIFRGWAFSWLTFIVAVIIMVLFFAFDLCPKVVGCILSLILFILSFRKSLYLTMASTSSKTGMIVGKGNTTGGAFLSRIGYAGPDADRAINEVNALVLDLQQTGDAAIDKWKR